MITPINTGFLQSDLDCGGYSLINLHGGPVSSRKYDVKSFGAVGDGVTDDTSAIQAALAAIPALGGVLYFPPGQYKYAGSGLTLSKQITVEGDGGGVEASSLTDSPSLAVTTIDFNSATGTLFTVAANGCTFKNLELRNTSSTTPSAGAGILVSSGGDWTNYRDITVNGFYIGIDVQSGWMQRWDGCYIVAPVLYGLKLRNIAMFDYGDQAISNCQFVTAKSRAATSAIRIESGGGIKIVNTKINSMAVSAFPWTNGIDLAIASGVTTSDLLVSNCSIENCAGYGIKGTNAAGSVFNNIVLTGNQIAPYISGANPYGIYLSPTSAGDFNGVVITGNLSNTYPSSSNPAIFVQNCSAVSISANSQYGYSGLVTLGSGVTFSNGITLPVYTVATLPASPGVPQFAAVSDGAASLAWGATVTGGGTAKYLVWYNGTNWTVVGK